MLDLYDVLASNIAEEVTETLRCEDEPMFERTVDDMIWDAAMEVCKGDIDHYDVIDQAKALIDSSLYQAYGTYDTMGVK